MKISDPVAEAFTGERATHYPARVRRIIPGYDAMQTRVAAYVMDAFGADASVLSVGAGQGEEFLRLARAGWTGNGIAVEPSPAMRALGEAATAGQPVVWHADVPPVATPPDVALLILVHHFLADSEALSVLRSLRDAGTPTVLAAALARPNPAERHQWRRHIRDRSTTPDQFAATWEAVRRDTVRRRAAAERALFARAGWRASHVLGQWGPVRLVRWDRRATG